MQGFSDMKKRLLGCSQVWLVIMGLVLIVGSTSAQDVVPTGRIVIPALPALQPKLMPPGFTIGAVGVDADSPDQLPALYRYMIKPAVTPGGTVIVSKYLYDLHAAEILSISDPAWSAWLEVPAAPAEIELSFADLPANDYFFISVQFLDQDGAVSSPWGYQLGTAHIRVLDGFFRPQVYLAEAFLGSAPSSEWSSEIAGGQPLNFSWTADAESYGGSIVSYRHGWDLISADDPNDLGWSVPAGLLPQNMFASERSFQSGSHVFTLRVVDDAQQVTTMNWGLRVVPFVSREYQKELMVIDQVVDALANNWPDQSGSPRNDEVYRNAWWHFLAEGAGGVTGFNWDRDWWDHTEIVSFADVVEYKTVLCYAKTNTRQLMFNEFRPTNDVDKFVWLTPYVQRGGSLFLVGASSTESFLEIKPNYMVPMIFDTTEETLIVNGTVYEVGFGTREMPDGSQVQRGPLMFPYASAGIAALDWTSPNTKTIYDRSAWAHFERKADCVGLKGLVLDQEFRAFNLIGPGVITDTLWTEPVIDWQDHTSEAAGTLELFSLTFPFRSDEFVDGNISARTTPILPQNCDSGPAGKCILPMFKGISRFDYVREFWWDQGETGWPESQYSAIELQDGCGGLALTSYLGEELHSARTNGQTFGYFSYKSIDDKPSRRPDVYWGFDPYRFDHEQSQQAVRWVLQHLGLSINQ